MPRDGNAPLTARDLEFLQKIANGASSKELAAEARLGEEATINSLSRLAKKLGSVSRVHAVAVAFRMVAEILSLVRESLRGKKERPPKKSGLFGFVASANSLSL
jgi:DNA-binding CsgD family transcriptional regulator